MNRILNVAWREFSSTVFTKTFLFSMLLPPVIMIAAFSLMPLLMNRKPPAVTGHIAVIDRSGAVQDRVVKAFSPEEVAKRRDAVAAEVQKQAEKVVPQGLPGDVGKQAASQAKQMLTESTLTVKTLPPDTDVDKAKEEILAAAGKEKDAQGADPRLALVVIPDAAVKSAASDPAAVPAFENYELFVAPKLDVQVQNDIERQVSRAVIDARIEAGGLGVDRVRALTKTPDIKAQAVTRQGTRATNQVAQLLIPGAFMLLLWISVFSAGQYLLTSTIEEKSSRVMEVLLSAVSPIQLMSGKILGQLCVGLVILVAYAGAGVLGLVAAAMMDLVDLTNLVYLAIYFMIAFALVAAMMAAIGSAVSDIREAQSLMGPVMIVLVIPMMLWMPIMRNPNSGFATVCSFIPPISPFVMVLRLAGAEKVPTWQIPATIVVGIISVYVAVWAAAKIFRIGVLMYGKPPNFRTLLRWVRMA
jgi:ABC-2 type transport system permease protein